VHSSSELGGLNFLKRIIVGNGGIDEDQELESDTNAE
jgi:hypothetical protein